MRELTLEEMSIVSGAFANVTLTKSASPPAAPPPPPAPAAPLSLGTLPGGEIGPGPIPITGPGLPPVNGVRYVGP